MSNFNSEYKHIDIDSEKLDRIINAALEEFSKKDYDKASTNSIVKRAGVSRGLLYHYFKNKEELFDFIVKHIVKTTFEEIESDLNWDEPDLFERLRQGFIAKMNISKKYPYLMDFYFANNNEKVLNEIKVQSNDFYKVFSDKFYRENIDFSKFKDDIDIDKTINTVVFTLKGIGKKILKDNADVDMVLKEYDEYVEYFKEIFYK